eukprot:Gregarina_sp_Poly_1__1734@NODE_1447_length_4129_cov_139_623584_g959_i0_p4_GENE_NODE_1447_length_4129_cov_139_623584_g959_i0NODE_1447_length_4129_cov_139_623584_g959_i0_p4_ORF_typecomplete_len198_score15_54Pribosyltran/PF00156_27/1_4e14Pribosyl_synth/PF14572_6/0_0027_NODE_1447_length_4129_cov_139_623584_g959_i034194012
MQSLPFEAAPCERGLVISDDHSYSKALLVIPPYYQPLIDYVLIPKGMIIDRIEKLALDIHRHYMKTCPTSELNLVCTLKGALHYFEHLTRFLRGLAKYSTDNQGRPAYVDHYVKASSYSGMTRSDEIQVCHVSKHGQETSLAAFEEKDILIVEDILDSGRTLEKLRALLQNAGARSVRSTVLFTKSSAIHVCLISEF